MLRGFCAINGVAEGFGDLQRRLYETPLSYGGLGMRDLYDVREAAYVGGWLQCLCHLQRNLGDAIPGFDAG